MEFKQDPSKIKCFKSLSSFIINKLENFFYWYGYNVSSKPVLSIAICLLICLISSMGLINFTKEGRPFKLWIPRDSEFLKVREWQNANYPSEYRRQFVIYQAENIFKKEVILKMLDLHDVVKNITTYNNVSYDSVCAKVPDVPDYLLTRNRRNLQSNPLIQERGGRSKRQLALMTCFSLSLLEEKCLEVSLLSIWNYDREKIESLHQDQILSDINKAYMQTISEQPLRISKLLGGIERDEDGYIIAAKAAMHIWINKINESAIESGNSVDDAGTMATVDKMNFEWELEFLKTMENELQGTTEANIYYSAEASFGIITAETMIGEVIPLIYGCAAVFVFVQITLGKFNLVEQRPLLSLFGLSCIGLALLVTYGVCSAFSVPFNPVNNVLPLLLLGLGVDDMFIIMQCWNNLTFKERKESIPTRIALSLKHAGVSITITSLTDFVVFVIGATTVLPGLKSFCLYAAIAVAATYFFQATFFVAWFALDQKRLEGHYHGLFWFWKIKNWQPNSFSQKNLSQIFFDKYFSRVLLLGISKVIVIIVSFAIFGVSCWGTYNLEQQFTFMSLFPKDSHLYNFFDTRSAYFESNGPNGLIYFGNITLSKELPKLDIFIEKLKENEYIGDVNSWYDSYKAYWISRGYNVPDPDLDEDTFLSELAEFLFSPHGSEYKLMNFKFDGILNCTDPVPPILASTIQYKHKNLNSSKIGIAAMDELLQLTKAMNFSGYVQPMSVAYSAYETDKIIEGELYRNLGMATAVIFVMTLLLIASFSTGAMVFLCVVMTLCDVMALMHWWGLTIDTVSSIALILAVGLCVDYAAHIGHCFMTIRGSRNERAQKAVTKIGPAVFKGGFSMFLSFTFVAGSTFHVSITFFKVFLGVCWYGLFHGLVFLPVLLSLIGPPPYESATFIEESDSDNMEETQLQDKEKNVKN